MAKKRTDVVTGDVTPELEDITPDLTGYTFIQTRSDGSVYKSEVHATEDDALMGLVVFRDSPWAHPARNDARNNGVKRVTIVNNTTGETILDEPFNHIDGV